MKLSGTKQTRATNQPPTLVKRADGLPAITGYAAVFYDAADPGTEYRLWSDMVERVRPGAFDRAIREDDVRALFNHDEDKVLGRTVSKTCRLSVDAKGLRYEIDPPDTQCGRDVVTVLGRGDVSGSSFAFIPTRTSWEEIRDADTGAITYVRWIEDVKLYDVGPVTFPAYQSTEAGTRNDGPPDDVRAEFDAWRAGRGRTSQADADLADVLAAELMLLDAGD